MNFLRQIWLSLRSNKYFVAAEGGAYGAALNYLTEAASTGHLDFSKTGFEKLATATVSGALIAVRLLYRPSPGTNPK